MDVDIHFTTKVILVLNHKSLLKTINDDIVFIGYVKLSVEESISYMLGQSIEEKNIYQAIRI